jgi:hypothetical protein
VLRLASPATRIAASPGVNTDGKLGVFFDDPGYTDEDIALIHGHIWSRFKDRIELYVTNNSFGLRTCVSWEHGTLAVTFTPSNPLRQILADCSNRATDKPLSPQGIICPHARCTLENDPLTTRVGWWLDAPRVAGGAFSSKGRVAGNGEGFQFLGDIYHYQR